ncbi:MAG: hypothetical protein ACYSSO_14350 [Planctomycetota bacterium]|jgi:predicted DNA-binding transcriptional regulator
MMPEPNLEKLYQIMDHVGMGDSVAKIYGYLLLKEYASINKICSATNLSKKPVKDSIERLLELRVIAFDMVRDTYVLYALDPEVVWPAFANETKWRFSYTLPDYDLVRPSDNLPVRHRDLFIHVFNSVDEIKAISSEIFRSYAAVENHKWRDAIDNEHMATLLSEAIQQAQSVIQAVSSSPRLPQVALIWQSLVSRMEDGVSYHRIADLTEIIEHGLYIVGRDMEKVGVNLMVLGTSDVEHKFYIIDKNFVVVFHRTGGVERFETIGRVTNHKPIIGRYRKRFESYREMAVPGHFVLQVLQTIAGNLLRKATSLGFNKTEQTWFECLINWGTFCHVEDPSLKDPGGLEERALQNGLITYGTENRPVPNYGITMSDIRSVWQQWSSEDSAKKNDLHSWLRGRLS